MFNAREWLNESGIPYSLSGKNISDGWIGVCCPYCSDHSNHGGISPTGTGFSCLRCGKKTSVQNLIKEIENCSAAIAGKIFNSYSDLLYIPDYTEKVRASHVVWPPANVTEAPLAAHAAYINGRGYDIDQLISMYGIQFGGYTGPFKYRIIIPVFLQGKIVSYLGRDITNSAYLRYKNLKEELSVLPVKETVYNIDNIHEEAIICEGITDAWRFGYNAVAMFGLVYTQKQVRMLGDKLKKAIICFDNEPQAARVAEDLAEELSWQGVDVEILLIDTADPGDMTKEEADLVKDELFGQTTLFKG